MASMLSFQRLDVYQRAIEFLALVYEIVGELPRGNADRADQLTRAAESVVRNIAEGAGRWSDADSANRYKIARGEAMECDRVTRCDAAAQVAERRSLRAGNPPVGRRRRDVDQTGLSFVP